MAALNAGVLAPDFTLPTVQGGQVSLRQALAKGPVVLVFFKVSCPVCQYALPFLERVYQANRAANVTLLGISQDKARDTKDFLREYGVTFPVALDNPAKYLVSNAYGLTNVPTIFYVAPGGEIEVSSVGWSKSDVETINQKLAEHRQQPPAPLWRKGEDIEDFRAG
ncbi:MAG: TlpA disulfide reductase family protein [Candidatus Korobacteraceae bacterium]|jgi:peroxiredoxin